jgi:hypothetical protein
MANIFFNPATVFPHAFLLSLFFFYISRFYFRFLSFLFIISKEENVNGEDETAELLSLRPY